MQVTQSASAELHRLLRSLHPQAGDALRLVLNGRGGVRVERGRARPGDRDLAGADDEVRLLVSAPSGLLLDDAVLHFRANGDDRYGPAGFTLLRQRGAVARTSGLPAEVAPSARPGFALGLRRAFGLIRGRGATTPSGAL